MEAYKIPVKIKLTTEIIDTGKKEVTVVEEEGSFYQKGNTSVLTFTEHSEEQDDINALITIRQEQVSVKRTGAVDMHQFFRKKRVTENVYKHAYGSMHMETQTDQITYQLSDDREKGKLFISYTTKIDGEIERRHRLTLLFTKEENQ
ncbi:DUF1934 family protein [Aquibacillus halophilus]|uniref:DUF1934 family protein n=1 Tax=Aquibacillus halophilus TaxID=930132 RepID=A0A6A8DE78_9BACI|nr:DUF1934 domain-containing protein [Aquibacillus halophilus]MRH43995.1 DUF1934 family protein [Aquibacillus halophilus]